MFTAWEKAMIADLIHDEITKMGEPTLKMDKMRVADLWNVYHKLEEV